MLFEIPQTILGRHKPHGFSASMLATGRELTLPPDLENDACAPAATNPYQEGSLIFVLTTPPERTNKLAPRWKGPFTVKRVPNPYQVVYKDGSAWRTIHINHAKPAKLSAADPPAPTPTPETPRPTLGYLPRSLQRPSP